MIYSRANHPQFFDHLVDTIKAARVGADHPAVYAEELIRHLDSEGICVTGPIEEYSELIGPEMTAEEARLHGNYQKDVHTIRCLAGANVLMDKRLSFPMHRYHPKFKDWIWGDLRRSIYDSMGIIMNPNDDRKITNG